MTTRNERMLRSAKIAADLLSVKCDIALARGHKKASVLMQSEAADAVAKRFIGDSYVVSVEHYRNINNQHLSLVTVSFPRVL